LARLAALAVKNPKKKWPGLRPATGPPSFLAYLMLSSEAKKV
jgi:hypothetical protein